MATLNYQSVATTGTVLSLVAAAGGGDKVRPNDRGVFVVRNGDSTSTVVTVVTPGSDKYTQARPDIAITVAAGAETLIGPFPSDLAGGDGLVSLTYSKVTSLTVGAVRI